MGDLLVEPKLVDALAKP